MSIESPTQVFYLKSAQAGKIRLPKPSIMGVINMSPDSFYRPYQQEDEILTLTEHMVESGANMIDVGGEATSLQIDLQNHLASVQQQMDRVLPVIEKIVQQFDVLVSVDTSQPAVMREAVRCGARFINDQRGLQIPGALTTVAELGMPVCLMHFFSYLRSPGSCSLPELLTQIKTDLQNTIAQCREAGIEQEQIVVDPGFGQGNYRKNVQENYYLLANLPELTAMGFPVLVGWSRKSMIGDVLDKAPPDRLYGSIAAATLAAMQGAAIIRVHDVAETADALKVFRAMRETI